MNNKKKVLFILHMPPPVHGAAMMGKYIHDSNLVNSEFNCHYINLTTAKSLKDIGKGGWRKLVHYFKLNATIRTKIKQIRPDAVYITPNSWGGAFFKDFLIVELVKKTLRSIGLNKTNIVVHFHNKGVAKYQNKALYNWCYCKFFNNLKVIILAESLYSDIQNYVSRDNVQICKNGIPDILNQSSKTNKENENDKGSAPFRILYLSNMIVEKGVWTLLNACAELKRQGIDFRCDFVGEWKDITPDDFNNKTIELGINDVVKSYGAKYGNEKKSFFDKADVMVFPTHNDCFPLVLLEGMMHGLACISTQEGGIPDIIDNNTGILVKKKDSKELAKAIEHFAKDRDLCRNMGHAGRTKYTQEFTLPKFEERITACLKKVLIQ